MKIRKSARAVMLNQNNEIFLFKFHFSFMQGEKTLWVTPGGGLNEDEDFESGLRRELFEETGLTDIDIGQWIWFRNKPFTMKNGEQILSEERYYLVRTNNAAITFEYMDSIERGLTKEGKWWSVESLKLSSEEFFTERLSERLQEIIDGGYFVEPVEV